MASRKKKDPAVLRTVDMFTGRTALEEAQHLLEVEEPTPSAPDTRNLAEKAEDCAVRWLGLDAFHEGDDIKVAVHPKGHAVLVLVRSVGAGDPYGSLTVKLSRAQWAKLQRLVRNPKE